MYKHISLDLDDLTEHGDLLGDIGFNPGNRNVDHGWNTDVTRFKVGAKDHILMLGMAGRPWARYISDYGQGRMLRLWRDDGVRADAPAAAPAVEAAPKWVCIEDVNEMSQQHDIIARKGTNPNWAGFDLVASVVFDAHRGCGINASGGFYPYPLSLLRQHFNDAGLVLWRNDGAAPIDMGWRMVEDRPYRRALTGNPLYATPLPLP